MTIAAITLLAADGREHRVPGEQLETREGKIVLPPCPESFAGVVTHMRMEYSDGSVETCGVVGRREVGES